MGLHAQIHQQENEVSIALTGEIHAPEYDQLAEIVKHFRNRGCRHFVLDLRGLVRMNAATKASLRRLVEGPRFRSGQNNSSAIRLSADNPAARPQTGCGDLVFSN